MNRRGGINIEIMLWVIGGVVASMAWAHTQFITNDTASAFREGATREVVIIRDDVLEIKRDVKDILKEMRNER